MKKFFIGFLVFSFISICFHSANAEIMITDMTGRKVSFAKKPERVICISPGTLRLIIYLEAKKYVVGVEDMEKQHPGTRPYWVANNDMVSLPSIGPGGPATINKEPDLEKILAVYPDVVFITYLSRKKADILQKKINIPVIVLSYGPFGAFNQDVYKSLQIAGQVLNKEERAKAVINYFEKFQKDLARRIKNVSQKRKPVYIGGIGFKGTHGIGSTETEYAPFEWVNANNIAKTMGKKGHLFVDKEKILSWNPDIIFIDSGGSELVRQDYMKKSNFYNELRAFKNKRVYTLHSFNWYMTNLGTVVADAYTVGKILYPERFKDIDPAKKADEVYTFLTGKPVYKDMVRSFGELGQIPDYLK